MPADLLLMALLAQSPAVQARDQQLDQIREAVARPPAITISTHADDSGAPVFRVKVEAWPFKYKPWEQPRKPGDVPNYVRPRMPLAHYEYLRMVTPEALRAGALYGPTVGVGFDPVIVKNAFNAVRRAIAERNARAEVRRDFEAYLQARAAAAR